MNYLECKSCSQISVRTLYLLQGFRRCFGAGGAHRRGGWSRGRRFYDVFHLAVVARTVQRQLHRGFCMDGVFITLLIHAQHTFTQSAQNAWVRGKGHRGIPFPLPVSTLRRQIHEPSLWKWWMPVKGVNGNKIFLLCTKLKTPGV